MRIQKDSERRSVQSSPIRAKSITRWLFKAMLGAILILSGCVPHLPLARNLSEAANQASEQSENQITNGNAAADQAAVPLIDGQAIFKQAGRMIRTAHSSILYEMYEIGYDPIIRELLAAGKRGVRVQVITDPTVTGSKTAGEQLARLGIEVRYLRIPHGIDHVKLLIADDKQALIGGMNQGPNSYRNHDVDVWLNGQAIGSLPDFFQQDWQRSFPESASRNLTSSTAEGEAGSVVSIDQSSVQTLEDAAIGRALLPLLRQAKRHIRVEMFTLTSPAVLQALMERKRAGVDVQVVLDPNQTYNRRAVQLLAAQGIPVRAYPATGFLLHMKLGLIDDDRVILGSANWTHAGLDGINHEMDVVIQNHAAANVFIQMFDQDFQKSNQF